MRRTCLMVVELWLAIGGGIPCKGIDGRLDGDGRYHDEPFSDPLPRCVINEVCISQSAYFLNAGRELAFRPTLEGRVVGEQRPSEIIARFADADEVAARAQIDASIPARESVVTPVFRASSNSMLWAGIAVEDVTASTPCTSARS